MAGFVKFNPDDWGGSESEEGAAKVAKAAKAEPTFATLATLASLPDDLADGLKRLAQMAVPRNVCPEAWAETVADAGRIVGEGWASQALSLGWSALDLFGAVTEPDADPHADGLAVWLSGRKLLAVSDCGAAAQASNGRDYFLRPRAAGARLLWTLGRG